MKLIKKISLIIFFVVLGIICHYNVSQAATLPTTEAQLYNWAANRPAQFFEPTPNEYFSVYGFGKSGLSTSDKSDYYDGPLGYCLGSQMTTSGTSGRLYIATIVDVDGNGNVTVYYRNNNKTEEYEVTDKGAKGAFNTLAYLATETHSYDQVSHFYHYIGYTYNTWRNNHIQGKSYYGDTGGSGDRATSANLYKNPKNVNPYKVRLMFVVVQNEQNRLIMSKMEDTKYGDLAIKKIDKDTDANIQGVQFIIQNSDGQYIKSYTQESPASKITFTKYRSQANKFETDKNGNITLNNIPTDTYIATEIGCSTSTKIKVSGIEAATSNFYKADNSSSEKIVVAQNRSSKYYLRDVTRRLYVRSDVVGAFKDKNVKVGTFINDVYKTITGKDINDEEDKKEIRKDLFNIMYASKYNENLDRVTTSHYSKKFFDAKENGGLGYGKAQIKLLVNRIINKYTEDSRIENILKNNTNINNYINSIIVTHAGIEMKTSRIWYYRCVAKGVTTMTFENEMGGSLEITKIDEDTKVTLSAKFTLSTKVNDVTYYYNDNTKKFTTKEVSFDVNGIKTITRLPGFDYTLQEVTAPSGYNINLQTNKTSTVKVNVGETTSKQVTNQKYGKIKIVKYAQGTGTKNPLNDAQFEIYKSDKKTKATTYSLSSNKMTSSTNKIYTTGKDGIVITDYLRAGTYWLKEIKAPDKYEILNEWTKVEIKTDAITEVPITIYNNRRYINLSGYVWEDAVSGKASYKDFLYTGEDDKKVANVRVRLMDSRTNQPVDTAVRNNSVYIGADGKPTLESTTYTNEEGKYTFKDVYVDDIPYYYIEFEYNGMSYESIPLNITANNGNKVSDENRESFNNNFAEIVKGKANKIENNVFSEHMELKYGPIENRSYCSQLIYGADVIYGYENAKYPIYGVDAQFLVKATTKQALGGNLDKYKSVQEIKSSGITEITDLNFGIQQREQPDLSLIQDIEKVEVSFNGGESHIFKYGQKEEVDLSDLLKEYEENPNAEYDDIVEKFQENQTYTRALFPSDIAYGNDNKGSGLSLSVIYRIGLENQTTNLTSQVNEFKFYFDETQYELEDEDIIKKYVDNIGKIKNITVDEGVATVKLSDMKIKHQTRNYVYIILNVKEECINELMSNNGTNSAMLNTYSEITSYSTFDKIDDKTYSYRAGIDTDSQPNSIDINKIETFEDDTDRAPAFKLVLQEERSISGTVFEDKAIWENAETDESINSGKERKGNSIYDAGEKGITGVTVKLIDTAGNPVKNYDLVNGEWKNAEAVTDENGNYKIEGVIPGEYQIQYIWGDQTYKVENYKSTIVDEVIYGEKEKYQYWYNNEFKSQKENGARYSDAIDNYNIRLEIDAENKDMKNSTMTEVSSKQMISTTPKFKINYEYSQTNKENANLNSEDKLKYDKETAYGDNEYTKRTVQAGKDENKQWTLVVKEEKYSNKIQDIDLGIIKRAKQDLKLNKRVKEFTLTLANGNRLVDAKVIKDENGQYQLDGSVTDVTYIPESYVGNGMLKVETNNEIIQSAQAAVKYEFVVENISEIEYLTEEYYKYGKVPADKIGTVVKLKPVSMIDYVDNSDVVLQTEGWDLVQHSDLNTLIADGLLTQDLEVDVKKVSKIMKINNIMEGENYLYPNGVQGQSNVALEMEVARLLAPNEDFEIGNQAEIVLSQRNGGSLLVSTHGNYNPTERTPMENDNASAEDITILPPTGENRDYIVPIIIGISILIFIGMGIIIIKNKITDNK